MKAIKRNLTILAFMQNMWARNPESVKQSLDRQKHNPKFWNMMCKSLLFAGCKSGRVLKQVFGELVWEIIWDECTLEIADNPKYIPKPDLIHIENTIGMLKPEIIITFGGVAKKAVSEVLEKNKDEFFPTLLTAPHPAARQPDTVSKLKIVFGEVEKLVNQPL